MQRYRPNPKAQRSSALGKALAVLEAVSDQPQSVGLPDLAARLNLPRQTLHRILVQLEEAGLLLRDPARERYCVGPRLSKLALAALSSRNQGGSVRAVLQDLVKDLGETCNVGVLDGLEYVYVERIECHWPLRTHLEAGSRMRAHWISGGKVMLAHLDLIQRQQLFKGRKLEASTSKSITKAADLEAELVKIRARGFAISNQEFLDGIVGVAVPVMDDAGRAIAALAVHGPVTRLSISACERHVSRLQRAAERLARALGSS